MTGNVPGFTYDVTYELHAARSQRKQALQRVTLPMSTKHWLLAVTVIALLAGR